MKVIHAHPQKTFLRTCVESYFFIESFRDRAGSTIPNGRLDISIVLEGQIEWYSEERKLYEVLPAITIYPLTSSGSSFRTTAGIRCFSIKLFPHVLTLPFFRSKPLTEPQPLSAFLSSYLDEKLISDLGATQNIQQMIALLDAYFLSHFFQEITSTWMQQAVKIIESNKQLTTVQTLADALAINIKTLERKFIQSTGLNPKQFIQIIQLQKATKKVKQENPNSGHGEISEWLDESYYDQSHFIKACKKITGMTPKQFFAKLPVGLTDLVID